MTDTWTTIFRAIQLGTDLFQVLFLSYLTAVTVKLGRTLNTQVNWDRNLSKSVAKLLARLDEDS